MPNNSRKNTNGRFARKLTWRAYASGPLIAVAFEIRICSNKNAPTGMIPVSECSRRSKKDVPCPARNGATPCLTLAGAAGLAVVATMTAPYELGWEDRTFYYPGRMEGKSRERGRIVNGKLSRRAIERAS